MKHLERKGWLARRLASRWAPRIVVAAALGASAPALSVDLLHDDIIHRLMLEDALPDYARGASELYDFIGGEGAEASRMAELGMLPWHTDPGLELRFFRPLAGLLLELDHTLFGRDPVPAHAHSLLWFLAITVLAASFFRRMLRPTSATVATAIYALAGAHAMTTSWLAARHTLVGATFGLLAVWAYRRWRADGWPPGALLAPVAIAVGMLASETALGAVVFVVMHELVVTRGPWRGRVLAALPALAVGVAHLVFYTLAGYGTRESGAYLSPFDDPLAFGHAILTRAPLLMAELFGAFPVLIAGAVEAIAPPVALYGLASAGVCAALLVAVRDRLTSPERRRLVWLGASSVLCLLPMVGGVVGPRLLPLALAGSAPLLGTAMVEAWQRARAPKSRLVLRGAVVVLIVLHLGLGPLVRVSLPGFLDQLAEAERALALEADLEACPDSDAHAYLLTGADPALSLYGAPSILLHRPEELARLSRQRVISMAPHGLELTVTSPSRFELATIGSPRTANLFERVYRRAPLERGQEIEVGELRVTVDEVEDGYFRRASFEVEGGLESVCFLVWQGGRLRAMAPPEVGRTRVVAHELGPLGL